VGPMGMEMGMAMAMGLRGLVQASPKRRHGGRPRRMHPRLRRMRLHPHSLAEKMGRERQMAQMAQARVVKDKM
jgi:hypothetical protein